MDLVYELLSQAVKNTNITINLFAEPPVASTQEPKKDEPKTDTEPSSVDAESQLPQESGLLMRADLVQLISDLESISSTLKRINRSLVGHEYTEVFFMLQNFDKILNSIKMIVNAV